MKRLTKASFGKGQARSRHSRKAKKGPRQRPWALDKTDSEWRGCRFLGGAGSNCSRLLGGPIKLANSIRANLPRGEFQRGGLGAFVEFALVLAAHQRTGDDDLVATAKPCSGVIQAIEADPAVPIGS